MKPVLLGSYKSLNKTLVFKNTIKIQHNQVYVSCKIFQLFGFLRISGVNVRGPPVLYFWSLEVCKSAATQLRKNHANSSFVNQFKFPVRKLILNATIAKIFK